MVVDNYLWIGLVAFAVLLSLFVYFKLSKKSHSPKEMQDASKQPKVIDEATQSPAPKVHVPQHPEAIVKEKKPLVAALSKTRTGWIARLTSSLNARNQPDSQILEEVEEILFSADLGVKTSAKLLDLVKENMSKGQDKLAVMNAISTSILEIFERVPSLENNLSENAPYVIMFVGVNGVGKTTTIGKIAAMLTEKGKKVILAAGDTFRAAASEQLEIWATRTGAQIVRGQEGADPSSVLFDALKIAKEQSADFVLCDTAGRLHTKINLMDELKKVHKVIGKACEGAPHEVLLVVDATTGQNAIEQARQFSVAAPLTGVVLTKLDGTAKGGIAIGISDELSIPIRYIGVGEKAEDLRPFSAKEFVAALFDGGEGALNETRV